MQKNLLDFNNSCIEADMRKDPHRFDGFYRHIKDASKAPKTMKIEVELTYPWCDHYPANDAAEFLKESVQDWLNANLSDGDNRLRLVSVSVKSDNMTYTTH